MSTLDRAKELRKSMTYPERVIWNRVRRGQIGGYKFRRQHPIGPYVADFYCHKAKLVIEIDGLQHNDDWSRDRQRDGYMRSKGLKVVRLTVSDVYKDVDGTIEQIASLLPK
ncbi:MAG: endonuclease domain-containing protein [Planctomycetota bacterium]|jgi:very-short-patch-repair endonuclease